MIVGSLEGAFLKMMTQLVQATSVLEIGMFTGYSALCFAEALPVDGTVLTCDLDEKSAALARQYFARSPIGKKIEVRMGPALDTMRHLKGPFDLIFIDADKINITTATNTYIVYYFDTAKLELRRRQTSSTGTKLIAQNLTNTMFFRAETYRGSHAFS